MTASMLPGGTDQRRITLEILGIIGVLEDPGHPGFASQGIRVEDMVVPGGRSDIGYPFCWWRGAHGVRWENARRIFGDWLGPG
jgi:hypothetical protein